MRLQRFWPAFNKIWFWARYLDKISWLLSLSEKKYRYALREQGLKKGKMDNILQDKAPKNVVQLVLLKQRLSDGSHPP